MSIAIASIPSHTGLYEVLISSVGLSRESSLVHHLLTLIVFAYMCIRG